MSRSVLVLGVFTLLAVAGCNYGEQQRHARDYEQFLKRTLGTAEPAGISAQALARAKSDTGLD
jgi:uncharacterized lipoprotein